MSLERLLALLWQDREAFLSGIWVSVQLAVLAMILRIALGLLVCVASLARHWIIRAPAVFYVEFCRIPPSWFRLSGATLRGPSSSE